MSVINELLKQAVELGASDVHLKSGKEPILRIDGRLVSSGYSALTAEQMQRVVENLLPEHHRKTFAEKHETDFSFVEEGVGRFRINMFISQGQPTLAIRYVKSEIPSFEELRLPTQVQKLAHVSRGIIILSGTTGSGKSTTLAAMINEINHSYTRRIITVEDPIEYLLTDEKSTITQREVGLDTPSFQYALRSLMRQDPDVILIGEMRDTTSIRTALLAAETGHLVLSTLHAGNASLAVPRALDVFPKVEQDHIRMGMAANLASIICQRLLQDIHGKAIPTVEIMINTPTVRKLLERNELETLGSAIETGRDDGMQSFDQSLYDLITTGQITEEEGLAAASNPESLRMNLQGIFLDEGRRILG